MCMHTTAKPAVGRSHEHGIQNSLFTSYHYSMQAFKSGANRTAMHKHLGSNQNINFEDTQIRAYYSTVHTIITSYRSYR